jgi:translation initiation factor 3 subunit F
VPHSEKEDEQYVAINKDYHKSMLSARRRITRREVVVGWFSTTTIDGGVIIDNSSLIHDFYSRECADPVHIVVDTTLAGDNVGVRAFVSAPMAAGPYSFANMFHEVSVSVEVAPFEAICMGQMVEGQREAKDPWSSATVLAPISSSEQALAVSTEKMLAVIDQILHYVTEVSEGRIEARPDVGMLLADTLGLSGAVRVEDFQSLFQSKTQDLLMVNYLTTLIQNQLAIAEKLQQII